MRIREVIWKIQFIEKLKVEHKVTTKEVESVIFGEPHVLEVEKGRVKGENVYEAFGQTSAGRHFSGLLHSQIRGGSANISTGYDPFGEEEL